MRKGKRPIRIVRPIGSSGPKSSPRTVSPMTHTRSRPVSAAALHGSPFVRAQSRTGKKSRVVPMRLVAAFALSATTCCDEFTIGATWAIPVDSVTRACASSSSSRAGRSASRSPLLDAGRGWTISAFEPSESMVPETTRPAPSASATTTVTAAMPTRMPNAVKAARTGR